MSMSLDRLYDIGTLTAKEFMENPRKERLAIAIATFNSAGDAIKSELK